MVNKIPKANCMTKGKRTWIEANDQHTDNVSTTCIDYHEHNHNDKNKEHNDSTSESCNNNDDHDDRDDNDDTGTDTTDSSTEEDNHKVAVDSNELFKELISKQIKTVPINKKLHYADMKRICKYISGSIFDENKCCIWNGYVTNSNNNNKGTYINFYFKKRKAALHRLLFSNFVGELEPDEYLKFNCENKGNCCNITHLKKFKYNKKPVSKKSKSRSDVKKENKKTVKIVNRDSMDDSALLQLKVEFF